MRMLTLMETICATTGSMRSLRIEIDKGERKRDLTETGSMRSLRIEISDKGERKRDLKDRLHAEPEDRNTLYKQKAYKPPDRLHAEPEDRNIRQKTYCEFIRDRLHAEPEDRNISDIVQNEEKKGQAPCGA